MEKNTLDYMSKLNAYGVIGREFKVDAPFLTNPITLKPIEYSKEPIEIINFKSFDTIDDTDKGYIQEQVSNMFMMPDDVYTGYQEDCFSLNILKSDNCNNPILQGQYGLFTKTYIKQYQVLGFYSGVYIASEFELEHMMTQFDDLTLGRYGNACIKEGIPVICGHYNGNYMSVINDWRPFKWYEYDKETLNTIKNKYYSANSIIAFSAGYYFIIYIASCAVEANTEIFTDYGIGYWERERNHFESI
jgi:hypothetical protein